MHTKIVMYIIFFAIWYGLAGFHAKSINIIFSIIAPLLTLILTIWLGLVPKRNHFKLASLSYCAWLLKEILMSSIAVVKIAFRKNIQISPSLEPIRTIQKSDIGTVLYANSITLTPGTVTLSVENKYLLVHALDSSFMDDLKDGKMDRKIREIVK
jgi:multicomponent Na+:H+ antiporter subunit E